MNLAQLTTAVYTETNRPDMVDETQNAILAATLMLHYRGDYLKDIQPAIINFGTANYINTLDTTTLPRYRRAVYATPGDVTQTITTDLIPGRLSYQDNGLPPLWYGSGFPGDNSNGLIEMVEAADIFNVMGARKINIMYQAGMTLYIKTAYGLQYMQFAYLSYPDLSVDNFSSWIADQYPWAIVYKAAADVFSKAGYDAKARVYDSGEAANENPGKVVTWLKLLDKENTVG